MSLIDSIVGAESNGDPNATNARSSATGAGQFIKDTWIDMLAKHRPDITGTEDQLLALRNDPNLSKEMTAAYASDNQAILSKAGHPVTPGNTYLAHFAGPGGAVSVLNADPSTPIASILPSAMKANPFLQGMTAGDLRAWADRKMGGQPQTASASPASPPSAPLNLIPPAPPPIFAQQPQPAPQEQPSAFAQMPAPQMAQAPPIFIPQRKQIDLSGLRAALARSPIFSRG